MSRRSHRANRQFERNITGYLKPRRQGSAGAIADTVFHVFAALFCILLPLSLVAFAGELVFRVPDLMAFEADRNGVLGEFGIDLSPEAVSTEIADYLNGEKDALTLTMEVAHKNIPVFSFMDEVNLGKINALLDKVLYPSIAVFALSIILFIIVRLAGRLRYLLYALRISVVLYICSVCFVLALAFFAPFREIVFAWQPGLAFTDGELLPRLYGGLYPVLSGGAVGLISFIIYIALYSVLRRFTIEKETMFK